MKRNQYRKTFEFFSTEQQAAAFVAARKKQRRKAHMTPWRSADGRENKFIVWYYICGRTKS